MTKRRIMSAMLLCLFAAPANAANLGKSMAEPPKLSATSQKGFYDIERCIVLADYSDAPNVYRTPDRPKESLIFYSTGGIGSPPVIKLEAEAASVKVTVWQGGGKLRQMVEGCL
jgi:hypothetical protein